MAPKYAFVDSGPSGLSCGPRGPQRGRGPLQEIPTRHAKLKSYTLTVYKRQAIRQHSDVYANN